MPFETMEDILLGTISSNVYFKAHLYRKINRLICLELDLHEGLGLFEFAPRDSS